MSANIEQIKAMLERAGKTNLLQKQKVDLDKERLQLEAAVNTDKIDNNLEEAAEEYLQKVKAGFLRTLDHPTAKDCFIHGAEWQKEQMLKDAVDGVVEDWNPEPHPEITIPLNPEEFTAGDKIKLIVVKED